MRGKNTMTAPQPPAGYSTAQLLFQDEFTSPALDTAKWRPWLGDAQYGRWGNRGDLPAPYSGPNQPDFGIHYNDPYYYGYATKIARIHMRKVVTGLRLIATPSTHFSPYLWASACVTSYGLMELPAAGGYVQVRARMPDCNHGMWPGIWMLAQGAPEIDLMEGGYLKGSVPVNQVLSANFHAPGASQTIIDTGIGLNLDFHLYGCEYRPGESVIIYFDGNAVATYTTGVPAAGPRYQLLLDLEVAGPTAAGWHTVADAANHPGPFQHNISCVQMYRLP